MLRFFLLSLHVAHQDVLTAIVALIGAIELDHDLLDGASLGLGHLFEESKLNTYLKSSCFIKRKFLNKAYLQDDDNQSDGYNHCEHQVDVLLEQGLDVDERQGENQIGGPVGEPRQQIIGILFENILSSSLFFEH